MQHTIFHKRTWTCLILLVTAVVLLAGSARHDSTVDLLHIYSRPPAEWPAPDIEPGIKWSELNVLPAGPVHKDSQQAMVALGKALFFDTRLSGSGKISCATCHQPDLSWTDGKSKSIGHEGAENKRNSPSIQNSWFATTLFWDGRAKSLEDQAFAPISSESEMHHEMAGVMRSIRNVKGYKQMFQAAFGDDDIDPDRLTKAIAVFERTIHSAESRFDQFIKGNRKALSGSELRGLHIFRTKAGCMNCHNGPLFTDNNFHHNGQVKDPGFEKDKGRYQVTHFDEDLGKFRTPSLRDVMFTGPWMHDGSSKDMDKILSIYNKGGNELADPLIRPRNLKKRELKDLENFLKAISAPPVNFTSPMIPQ